MFCKSCGNEIKDDSKFCPNCGEVLSDTPESNESVVSDMKVSKKFGKLLIPIIAAAVVVVSLLVVLFISASSKGYEKEVKNYLEYFASENKDVEEYLSVGYFGGNFGDEFIGGKSAAEANVTILKVMFEQLEDMSDMYSYDFDYSDGDWKDYVEESIIDYFYESMEETFGDWKLTYKITDSKKLSDSKIEDLQDILDESIEYYEDDVLDNDDIDISSDDKDVLEDFVDSITKKDIKEAYEVEVDVKIDGDDASIDESYEFKVAKVGKSWIILEGPSMDDIMWDAED